MRRRYYLQKRGQIYYAQLVNPITHKATTLKSTGATSEEEARLVVAEWLTTGVPAKDGKRKATSQLFTIDAIVESLRKAPELTPDDAGRIVDCLKARGLVASAVIVSGKAGETVKVFLEEFWDYEISPYLREKRAHTQRTGKRHAYESRNRVRRYWMPDLGERRLVDIKKADLKALAISLADKGLNPTTINLILVAGKTALRWAFENEIIPTDPTVGLKRFSGSGKKRGILSREEAEALFDLPWEDERARIGNILAMTTGLRSGEILALRGCDIGEDRLFIRHSWSDMDGLKTPKNGEERIAPLVPFLRGALRSLVFQNPHGLGEEGFIFYSTLPRRPMDNKVLLSGLREALIRYSVGENNAEEERRKALAFWRDRNIVFHSWRHFFASRMADAVDERQVMQATGHKDRQVFEAYAAHATEADFRACSAAANNIFSFAEAAARIRLKEGVEGKAV